RWQPVRVTPPRGQRRLHSLEDCKSSGKEGGCSGGNPGRPPDFTMASDGCSKEDLLEDGRTDSGIESYSSILKSEEPQEPSGDFSGPRDKFSTGEERLDSAYTSSSITVESLSEIVEGCSLSSAKHEQAHISELSEQENLLTTITEDGDT
ncbi:hypothetical protein XENOCAPTIV_008724, partial [Xenoophorus captivus]